MDEVKPNGTFEEVNECIYCGSDQFIYYRKNGPHIQACCGMCGRNIKFVTQYSNDSWSRKVKENANYHCERCGKLLVGREAHAHHKVPTWFKPEWKYKLDNGMCLCNECHKQIHGYGGTIKEQEE